MVVNGYDIEPGADLINADLAGAYLSRANLESADLEGADLTGADLRDADLRGTDLTGAKLTSEQIKSTIGGFARSMPSKIITDLLQEISFRMDVEVIETPENRDRIIARLEQLSADVARLAGISKERTPAKTILAAIEASNLTPQIMELVSDAVLDCADME